MLFVTHRPLHLWEDPDDDGARRGQHERHVPLPAYAHTGRKVPVQGLQEPGMRLQGVCPGGPYLGAFRQGVPIRRQGEAGLYCHVGEAWEAGPWELLVWRGDWLGARGRRWIQGSHTESSTHNIR